MTILWLWVKRLYSKITETLRVDDDRSWLRLTFVKKEKGDCPCFSMRSISKEPNRPTIDKVLGVANGAIQLRIGAYKSYWLVTRTWSLEGVKRRWVMNAWRETLPINTSSSRVSYLLSARSDRWPVILQVKVESYWEPYFKSYLNPIILACKKLANDLWADQESRNTFAFRVRAHKSRYQPNHPIIKFFDNWPVPTRLRGCLWRTSESDSESKRSPLWQLTAIKSR